MKTERTWLVYIIQTACGKLYTGITTDVERRFQEHHDVYRRKGNKGAKFFRGHCPDEIVYTEACESRSVASKREYQIKTMAKLQKNRLINEVDGNI